ARLAQADWLVFTSANGLPHLLEEIASLGGDIRALGNARIAAIGPATAESVRRHHLHVAYQAERFVAESLAEGFPAPAGKRIVIARAADARDVLPDTLRARGADVEIVPVYRTVAETGEAPDLSALDAITFTSASTVRHFRALVPGPVDGPVIACIGPVTAQAARAAGLRVDIEAASAAVPALVAALEQYFAERTAA
ncbi:MAG TPA: uroporphyrinogen-III synthase, partial [Armatimonadota bacterium]|nr:uroporphyrinogen-III synthase [Armatimonadota bacterium]